LYGPESKLMVFEQCAETQTLSESTGDGIPGRGYFRRIAPELAALYTQACEKRVEAMENDLLEIADDTDRDYREGKNGQEIPNKEVVLRSKIRIESRQWLMSRRAPTQWGNKQSLDVTGNIMLLSPEERVHKAVQLFGLTEKFIERARNPIAGTPIEYDTGVRPLPPGKGRI
jgi:hypothetical protein